MDFFNSTDIAVASSPSADVNGSALILLCQLFGLVKEWLHAERVSIDSNGYGDDNSVEKEMMFSKVECQEYIFLTKKYPDDCDSNSTIYDNDVGHSWTQKWKFMRCLTYHFMTEMGGNSSCTNSSAWSDNSTTTNNTMSLYSKDQLFYSFMADTLNMTSTCKSLNDTLKSDTDTNATIFSYDNCDEYYDYVKYRSAESKCVHNTSATDSDSDRELPYNECLFYRFMKSLGAESGCSEHFALQESCGRYMSMMRAVVSPIIGIIGLIGNSISLSMFCQGVVKTPTTYQLQWLAAVDITFILTYGLTDTLNSVMSYASVTGDIFSHGIYPVLSVCLDPLFWVAKSCTVWLTVFIGVYRYLAVCKPYSNVYSHVMLHGRKYVKLIVILSFLYNLSMFINHYLGSYEKDGRGLHSF